MHATPSDVAFTPAVKVQQERFGSRRGYARMEEKGGWSDQLSPDLKRFIASRDSFYFGTATAEGRPYVQHRGGHRGFLKVVDERKLAFADYSGNQQYISLGNLSENEQAFLFLMDYPNRQRVKIWGRAEVIEDDPELLANLVDPDYEARPERVIVFHIEAWDANCPQHIQPRFTEEELLPTITKLESRIEELEAELAARSEHLAPEPAEGRSGSLAPS